MPLSSIFQLAFLGAGLTYSVNQIQVQAGAPAPVRPAWCRRRHDTAKEKVTTVEIVGSRAEPRWHMKSAVTDGRVLSVLVCVCCRAQERGYRVRSED